MIFLAASIDVWDELLSSQVGFILAIILSMLFYWRVILPREERREARMLSANDEREARMLAATDEQAKAISGLAVAVRVLIVHQLREEGKDGEEILRTLDNMPK